MPCSVLSTLDGFSLYSLSCCISTTPISIGNTEYREHNRNKELEENQSSNKKQSQDWNPGSPVESEAPTLTVVLPGLSLNN